MDVQTHRKQRLRELIDSRCDGVIARCADKVMRSESYIARMLYPMDKPGAKPIADKLMLAIEQAFDLERAWLDKPLGYGLPSSVAALDAQKDDVNKALEHALSDWRLHASPNSRRTIDKLSVLAQKNALRDEDWILLDQIASRLRKSPN